MLECLLDSFIMESALGHTQNMHHNITAVFHRTHHSYIYVYMSWKIVAECYPSNPLLHPFIPYLSIYLSIYLSTDTHLPIYLSISIYLSIYYLPIYLSISIYLSFVECYYSNPLLHPLSPICNVTLATHCYTPFSSTPFNLALFMFNVLVAKQHNKYWY